MKKEALLATLLIGLVLSMPMALNAANYYGSVSLTVSEQKTVYISDAFQNVLGLQSVTVLSYNWYSDDNAVSIVSSSDVSCTLRANREAQNIRLNYHVNYKVSGYPDRYETHDAYFLISVIQGSSPSNKLTISASPSGGTISQGTKVYLTPSIEGALIYYTLDGREPTETIDSRNPAENSLYYLKSEGITIENTCTLKALAVKLAYPNDYRATFTASYIVREEVGTYFTKKTAEGVDMTFQITSQAPKTCKVYNKDLSNHDVAGIDPFTRGKVTIPSQVNGYTVDAIGQNAFAYCRNLTEVIIPSTVKVIESGAFTGCRSLSNVVLPNNLTSLGRGAFSFCESLSSITIPSSVVSIGENPFNDCDLLESIEVDKNNLCYDSRESCNAIIDTRANALIVGCKKTLIPSSVKSIEKEAFYWQSIESVEIPDGVISIGASAFYACDKLEDVSLGSSLNKIGDYAFCACANIKVIKSYIKTPFPISSKVFSSYDRTILYVPHGTKDRYEQTEGWNGFQNIVEMESLIEENFDVTLNAPLQPFCVDKDLDFSCVTGLQAYIASGFNPKTGEVLMSHVKYVPSNTGVLLEGTAGKMYEVPIAETDFVYSNMLVGVTAETKVTSGYILNGNQFEAVNGGTTLYKGDAYLITPLVR